MNNHHDEDSGPAKAWKGNYQFVSCLTLFALSMEVRNESGQSLSGRLALHDTADEGKDWEYPWQATYEREGKWNVVGKGNGVNSTVAKEMGVFLRDRLDVMRREGVIFRPQPKTVEANGSKPLVPRAPILAVAAITETPPPALLPKPADPAPVPPTNNHQVSAGASPLEIARMLMKERRAEVSVRKLANKYDQSGGWVYKCLSLNDLAPELQRLLDTSLPSAEHLLLTIAYPLARLPQERQMEVYQKAMAIADPKFRLAEVNRLVKEIAPDRPRGRPRKPADHARKLRLIVERAKADLKIAEGFSVFVFSSLIANTDPAALKAMLDQLDLAIAGFGSLKCKILEARQAASRTAA
ncbi:MAG: hypothetical protein Q7K35_04340 [bacterium]|nr:hypothetical protein [bacterium]